MSHAEAIMATLEEYSAAYRGKDLARLMAIFVDGPDISLIGTGADELCAGRDEVAAIFERNLRDATATAFEWGWRDIVVHGDMATVAIAVTIRLEVEGAALEVPIRWTVVLTLVDGRWRWVHRNASSAAGGQKQGTAYPVGPAGASN